MLFLLRPALCLSLGGLLVVAAFVGTAAAQTGVEVVIQPPGNQDPASISTDDVAPDVTDKTYKVQSGGNASKEVKVAAGVSLRALLDETDTGADYATIQIPRGDRKPLLLTKKQVENRLALPVFFADAQGRMSFIWPTADDSAIPAGNFFRVPSSIALLQRARQRLKVEISPRSKQIEPGGTIEFRATTSGDRPGETVVYYWSLGDKRQRRGGKRHIQDFPEKDGVYEVHVLAVIESAGVRDTDSVEITVGDPDSKDGEQTDPDDGTTDSAPSGSFSPAPTPYTPAPVSPPSPAPIPTTPSPLPEPVDPPDTSISGTTVEGNLLADVGDPPPSNILESAAQAARDGNLSGDSDAGVDLPQAAVSIAAAIALLALGAGIENRQGRPLRRRFKFRPARS